MSKLYERNIASAKFYQSSAHIGSKGYNPKRIEYYGSDNKLVRIEEIFDGKKYGQTISGSNYVQQWPNYSYSITYYPWDETTV